MSPGGEHFSGVEVQKVCLGVWLEQKICDRQRREMRLECGEGRCLPFQKVQKDFSNPKICALSYLKAFNAPFLFLP